MRLGPHHKIGRSKNPSDRQLRLALAEVPEIVHLIESRPKLAPALESALHRHFADKCVRGEWFSLDEEDVCLVRSVAACRELASIPKWIIPADPVKPDSEHISCPHSAALLYQHKIDASRWLVVRRACRCWHCPWCFYKQRHSCLGRAEKGFTELANTGWTPAVCLTFVSRSDDHAVRTRITRAGDRYVAVSDGNGSRRFACAIRPGKRVPLGFTSLATLDTQLGIVKEWMMALNRPRRLASGKRNVLIRFCNAWSSSKTQIWCKDEWRFQIKLWALTSGPLVAALEASGVSPRLVEGDEGWLLAFTSDAGPEAVTARLLAA